MRYALIVMVAAVAVGGCKRGSGGSGGGTVKTVKQAAAPPTAPKEWTAEEISGTYVWGCDGKLETEIKLGADGSFSYLMRNASGESTTKGQIVRQGDKLALSDKPHYAPYLSHHFLRSHQGRKVLVREDHVASFDLLPSWHQASVKLKLGEGHSAMCKEMRPWPGKNPPSPGDSKVRLPASFKVTFTLPDPGGVASAEAVVTSAPWWAQAKVCPAGCTIPKELTLHKMGGWARLNRLWWAQAKAPDTCPGAKAAKEPYTLSVAGKTFKGDLVGDEDTSGVPAQPCVARRALVLGIQGLVLTMHPPAPPPRPAGGPRRE